MDYTGKQRNDPLTWELMQALADESGPADLPINDKYMCIGGLLYFKCDGCKCWCVAEVQHEHGYLTCKFCETLKGS